MKLYKHQRVEENKRT